MFRTIAMLLILIGLIAFTCTGSASDGKPQSDDGRGNRMSTALWFVHQFGRPEALVAGKDRQLKIKLTSALGKALDLAWDSVSDLFDRSTFEKLSGGKDSISFAAMQQLLSGRMPASRSDMNGKTRLHADLLTTQFDLIEEAHREKVEELATWIVANYRSEKPPGIIVLCTGNTRRSMLGATMGNIAAAYFGFPDIRFFSGGTEPDAINPRTIATLREIGVVIEPTGAEAPRGMSGQANPIYRVQWGKGLETREFSKKYTDAQNPQTGFAAILVCSEADAACPTVRGASARIPVPFLDPKAFDGAAFESAKYAERRDDVGRFMLNVMMQSRRRLDLAGRLK